MIENLNLKLEGKEPITRIELFELVSWGIINSFETEDNIYIKKCESKDCYNLSNLDVSQIDDFSFVFYGSLYNGDLSKWNVSSCFKMNGMFWGSKFNNDSISNWDVSNVQHMNYMFSYSIFNNDSLKDWNVSNVERMKSIFLESKFNGNISNWDISKVYNFCYAFDNCPFDGDISKWEFNKDVDCDYIFNENHNFSNKYNYGKDVSINSNRFLIWFKKNKDRISNLNVTKEDEINIDDYLDNFDISKNNLEINKFN